MKEVKVDIDQRSTSIYKGVKGERIQLLVNKIRI